MSGWCGGDGAPHDVSRLAMSAHDVFIVAALVVLCSLLSLTGWPLQCRHGNIDRLPIDFKLGCICAWSVCRRVVRQLRVNRKCTEHDDSEGQGTKIVSRLFCSSLVRPGPLRYHCGHGCDLTLKPPYRVACNTTIPPSLGRGESSVWWRWRPSRCVLAGDARAWRV